nr:hypothetical protein [Marinicella sp. W31]MDC2879994.1 hypothetical protein [Marinicella sp. W31]
MDFTHGAALATAMGQATAADQSAEVSRYDAALEELLKAFNE